MPTPAKEFLRYGEVQDWLEELGIGRRESRALITCKVITGISSPRKNSKAVYYLKSQILRDVLWKMELKS